MSRPAFSASAEHTDLGSSREQDARWLAGRLRRHRLTILQGESGSGKSVLLRQGVMALLQRRTGDRLVLPFPSLREARERPVDTTLGSSRVVLPFPDRRRAVSQERRARDEELVIAISDWTAASVEDLRAALRAGLPGDSLAHGKAPTLLELMTRIREETGARVLLVLDDFDQCLKASVHRGPVGDFIDEWVQTLQAPESPVHTLIAMAEPSEPLWHLLRHQISGLGHLEEHRLMLSDRTARIDPGTEAADDGLWPESDFDPSEEDDFDPVAPDRSDTVTRDMEPSVPASAATRRGPGIRRVLLAAALLSTVLVVAVIAWPSHLIDPSRREVAEASGARQEPYRPSSTTAPGLPDAGFELVADSGDSSDRDIVADLARLLTPREKAAPEIRVMPGWPALLGGLGEQPRLAVATYDVLQAAKERSLPTLKIVTPLFSEEIYFVVRADSPLRQLRDIKAAIINTGPLEGSRALTTSQVYRRMFGQALPARQMDGQPREAGLEQLERGAVDVVVLVGAQPDPFLSQLTAERKRGLRLLTLNGQDPVERKALAAFLPALVEPARGSGLEAPGGTKTLAVMTFLVGGNDEAENAAAAAALCRNLPSLQKSGHPKWRELTPGQRLEVGWPQSQAAADVLRQCPTSNP